MGCCKCEKYKWRDPQPVVYTDSDNKGYCLFHAPAGHKGVSVDEFNAQVFKRIQITLDLDDETALCDLRGTVFSDEICFVPGSTLPKIAFSGASFLKEVSFGRVCFGGTANFTRTQFVADVNFSEAIFKGCVVSFEACFEENVDFKESRFEAGVVFSRAYFKGSAFFRTVSFGGDAFFVTAKIAGDACFANASFAEDVNFIGTYFEGKTYFEKNHFEGKVSFEECVFDDNAFFDNATFHKKTEVEAATFNGYASFVQASFRDHSCFKDTRFNNGATFFCAKFIERVSFNKTHFGGETEFGASEFRVGGDFSDATFDFQVRFDSSCLDSLTIFRRTIFKYGCSFDEMNLHCRILLDSARIEGPISCREIHVEDNAKIEFENTVILSGVTFQNCDPTCLDFTEQRDLSNIHFIDAPWEKNGRIKASTEDLEDKLQLTRDFYQRMKAKYKAENNEYEASKWHIAEKEAQRKLLRNNGESKFLRLGLSLYRWSSRFGEDPVLAGKWLVGFVALVWLFLGLGGVSDGQQLIQGPTCPNTWECISNFGTIFMTLFKNVMLFKVVEFTPQYGWIGGVVLIMTRLIIPLQAALFAFALRNRFRR